MLVVALLVVIAVVWLLIAQPWRGAETAVPAPTTSSPAATPTPTATDEDAAAAEAAASEAAEETTDDAAESTELPECAVGDVAVEAVTDQTSYAADQNPQLSIRLTNTSGADCAMNVGTSTQSFIITSGSDTYWRSTDCQSEPSDTVVTVVAGQTVTSASPITWDRTRSSVDSCDDAGRERAPGGGASYHLAVAIGGIPSTSTAQFQLD